MLLLGTDAALPTTEAAQASNPLLLKKRGSGGATDASDGASMKVKDNVDVSKLDAAQASQLLKKRHGMGRTSSNPTARHRRNVKRNYHDLDFGGAIGGDSASASASADLNGHERQRDDDGLEGDGLQIKKSRQGGKHRKMIVSVAATQNQSVKESSDDASSSEDDDDSSNGRRRRRRRRRSRESCSSSSSSDESSAAMRRRRQRRPRGASISSSSSDGSEDEIDRKRNRTRIRMREKQQQQRQAQTEHSEDPLAKQNNKRSHNDGGKSSSGDKVKYVSEDHSRENDTPSLPKPPRRPRSRSSSSSSSASSSSSSSGSSSSSSSDESDAPPITTMAKPLFVPKHKRQKGSEHEKAEAEKQAKIEKEALIMKEKRIRQSRALVAEVVASEKMERESGEAHFGGDQNEFAETGGSTLPPPNDNDDNLSQEEKMKEREAWEVRELMRIIREFEEFIGEQREIKEIERRRNMTDRERYEEDVRSGRYRKPGEQRRNNSGSGGQTHMQRYYHRGAFYMDDDTLKDKDDVRHRAAEYAKAATGDDKFDKSAMPKVMQVKKFGFAGYGTKYKGLSKEDTTDKNLSYLPAKGDHRRQRH